MWIIAINGEDTIIYQGDLDELNQNQTPHGKSKVKISLQRRNIYQRTYLEEVSSIFYQVRPMVLHLEVCLPNKPPKPNNIGECLKVPQRQLWKEALYVKYDKNKNASLILDPTPIKSTPEGTNILR